MINNTNILARSEMDKTSSIILGKSLPLQITMLKIYTAAILSIPAFLIAQNDSTTKSKVYRTQSGTIIRPPKQVL